MSVHACIALENNVGSLVDRQTVILVDNRTAKASVTDSYCTTSDFLTCLV